MRRQDSSGFTLIELLTVISIIAILASILFPVFGQARERARAIACLNNLSQMGRAMQMYADDNNDRLPPAEGQTGSPSWCGIVPGTTKADPRLSAIYSYIRSGEVFICPSDSYTDQFGVSYQMSQALSRMPTGQIDYPTQCVVLLDSNDPSTSGQGRSQDGVFRVDSTVSDDTVIQPVTALTSGSPVDGYNPVHNKRPNAFFADGHVASFKEGELKARNFRPNPSQ